MRISCAHKGPAHTEIEELFDNFEWLADNLVLVRCTEDYLTDILSFAGSIRFVFKIDQYLPTLNLEDIMQYVRDVNVSHLEGTSMRVKVFKIGKIDTEWKSENIERAIGSAIYNRLDTPVIDLKHPEEVVAIVVWSGGSAVGRFIREIKAKSINIRAPKNLPNSKGGAMKQTIAKLVVNAHRIDRGEYVLDPFCGHGGILYEMVEAGYTPIGIELDSRIIRQGVENMVYLKYRSSIHLIHGDALSLPLRRGAMNYVVTDPPYALQTTTSGRSVEKIITDWLNSFSNPVVISMSTPNETLKELPDKWKTLKQSTDYVHRGLTRRLRLITNG